MNAEITNPINLALITIGTFLGLTLGLFLLFNKSAKSKANIYLGILVLAILSYFLNAFIYRYGLLDQLPHIVGVSPVIGFLIGPLGYLYVRACTQKGFKFLPIYLLHFLPFVLDVFLNLPLLLQSGAEKVARYNDFLETGNLYQYDWVIIIKAFHGITYFALAAQLIAQYRRHLTNAVSSIDKDFHRWLLIFIIVLGCPILALLCYVISDFQPLLIRLALLGFFVFIGAIYVATLVKPAIFHAFPHQMLIPESKEEQKQKYESSNLKEMQKGKYVEKLVQYMETEKPYKAPELTLAQLSEQINIPSHYLSQVINEKLDCTFLDFINSYRVKEAQEKLIDPKYSHYTILSLAYEAGFNSKSTFYSVFKKYTGMTPNNFRKSKMAA